MDIYTALLYNETNFISLILLIIVFMATTKNNDVKAKFPSLIGFTVSLMVLTVGDIFWAFVNGNIIPFTEFWGYFTNMVYFLGTLTSVYFLFMLFQDIFGYNGNYVKKSFLFSIPFAIDLIFVMLTPITHLVFMYSDGVYRRMGFYIPTLCIPYAFVIYLCVSSFICSLLPKYYTIRRSLRIMTLYSLGTLLLSFFQLISSSNFPLYVVGGTLICVLIYIDSINELNTIDQLTRLQTRREFENNLSYLMRKDYESGKNLCFMLADIDDLKSINNIYGMDEGNFVLKEVAHVVKKCAPTGWMCARFGPDVFSLLGICAPEEVEHICTHINTTLEDYNLSSSKPYAITVSIGYALKSDNIKNVNDFIKLTEKHLNDVYLLPGTSPDAFKKKKVNNAKTETKAESEQSPITQQDINSWMNESLKNGEFVPYFQPQIDISDGTVSGAEALVRWIHPEKGIIFPGIFIPVFERNGFIYEMDKSIWHSVCSLIRKWKDEGINVPSISVNVSRWDIVQTDFTETLLSYLKEFNLAPSDLHLEITESAYLFDQEYLKTLMESLQNMGFVIEMDDFGSGYSSLTAFKDLPFNLLKLDASLIRESTNTEKAGNILKGIVNLANSLDMPLIAEGIEYREQADFLKEIGCNKMQGYLFAKPMSEDKFVEFITA